MRNKIKGKMVYDHLVIVLLFLLVAFNECFANNQEVNTFQNTNNTSLMRDSASGIRFALLNKHEQKYLNATPFLVLQTKNKKICEVACVKYHHCYSLNVKIEQNHHGEGSLRCELLSTDMFISSKHLIDDKNYVHFSIKSSCFPMPCKNGGTCFPFYNNNTHKCLCLNPYYGEQCEKEKLCEFKTEEEMERNGIYNITDTNGQTLQVYRDMSNISSGWTLIARMSNKDAKNWMQSGGSWWYDLLIAQGIPTNTTVNQDMISPAFWSVSGREIKMTRSDDPCHTPLLQTKSDCLGSCTFRSMISGYGNFRIKSWKNGKCLGSCDVVYGGKFLSTIGFSMASCNGSFQNSNKIGFWCGGSSFLDGAVMMIGGGGTGCARADHGVAITETNDPAFGDGCDFGDNDKCSTATSYAINLWIK